MIKYFSMTKIILEVCRKHHARGKVIEGNNLMAPSLNLVLEYKGGRFYGDATNFVTLRMKMEVLNLHEK